MTIVSDNLSGCCVDKSVYKRTKHC